MSDRDCKNCKHHTEKGCDSWDCEFERRMARKEIIEMLKVLKEQALKSHNDTAIIDVKKDSFIYVMNVAINSLEIDERYELEYEQIEPCENAISRQAVLDGIDTYINKAQSTGTQDDFYSFAELVVKQLPSVNPQEPFMNKPCVAHQVCHEDKIKVLNKIRAEIAEYGSIWVVYKITGIKDKDIERLVNDVLKQAKEQVLDVIDKYIAESEEVNDTDI